MPERFAAFDVEMVPSAHKVYVSGKLGGEAVVARDRTSHRFVWPLQCLGPACCGCSPARSGPQRKVSVKRDQQ